ncbi:MAG: SDR family oxidoreductase [Planctomycetaceae bacterium]
MSYHLLTGATGLLGNYLLRDLLLANVPVAVLVRSNRRQTARQRVEAAMCAWDAEIGRPMPRPVVLEGDIAQPDLGLEPLAVRWVAEYCSTVIHNAASLTFHSTSEDGEPWRSNVGGVKNVLEFCRNTGIRKLHHVSTAYVAGLRQGRVLETELDVGQEFSNDYERSKLEAELLVRQADFLDPPTFFRPGIIIGDSKTGLTTTYHGYYAALQLSHTIVRAILSDETGLVGGQRVRLTLNGTETKHLVPVDWVSAVMVHVMTHPELHAKTYHLTPRHPVTTRMIRDVLEQSAGFYGAMLVGAGDRPGNASEAEALFYEHIRVYNSYWKMDPVFDTTNTNAAAPHLPCPHIDRDLLYKLSRIVIESEFPGPSKRPLEPDFDVESHLQSVTDQVLAEDTKPSDERLLGLEVCGHGGGQWQLIVRGNRIVGLEIGNHEERKATCKLDVDTFAALAKGQTTWRDALQSGAAEISGNGRSVGQYSELLEQLVSLEKLAETR